MNTRNNFYGMTMRRKILFICLLFLFVVPLWAISKSDEADKSKSVENIEIKFSSDKSTSPSFSLISLQVFYEDNSVIEGEHAKVHKGVATYVFKNNLSSIIKLQFPPIGYTAGGFVPITPQCCDKNMMPKFCQNEEVIELKPYAERRFTSKYTFLCGDKGNPPSERFVFGPSPNKDEEGFLVDAVQSTPKYYSSEKSEKTSK